MCPYPYPSVDPEETKRLEDILNAAIRDGDPSATPVLDLFTTPTPAARS